MIHPLSVKLFIESFIPYLKKNNYIYIFNSWHFGLAIAKYPKTGTETQRILYSTSREAFA